MKNGKLLIVGAGSYAVVAAEIAEEMGCFDKIAFVDDQIKVIKIMKIDVLETTK